MREQIQKQSAFTIVEHAPRTAELDLVIPFTTPELTRVALAAANRMGAGLHAALRLVKVQVVPYPLDLNQSPVYVDFLKEQMQAFESALPVAGEVRLARNFEEGLKGTLDHDSVVVLATKKRPWKTRAERLAASLRRSGYKSVLINQGAAHA